MNFATGIFSGVIPYCLSFDLNGMHINHCERKR